MSPSIVRRSAPLRGPRSQVALVFTGLLLVLVGWLLATPLFAAPDEAAHIIRAAAVSRGELEARDTPHGPLVEVPTALARLVRPVGCMEHRRQSTGDCRRTVQLGDGERSLASTPAAGYNPVYYLIIGSPLAVSASALGVYAARLLSAVLCAGLLTAGVMQLRSPARRLVALAGLTPTVMFLASSVNPLALEICSCFLVWSAGLRLATARSLPRPAIHGLGVGAVLLSPTRPLSFVWLLTALAATAVVAGPARLRLVWSVRAVRLYAVAAVACVVEGFVWTRHLSAGVAQVPGDPISYEMWRRELWHGQALRLREMIGTIGWNDVLSPAATYGVWIALFLVAIGLGIHLRSWKNVTLVLALCGLLASGSALLDLILPSSLAFFWQGRYNLPIVVGLPLLLISTWKLAPGFLSRHRVETTAYLGGLLAIGHCLAYFGVLRTYLGASPDQYRSTAQHFAPAATTTASGAFLLGLLIIGAGLVGAGARRKPLGFADRIAVTQVRRAGSAAWLPLSPGAIATPHTSVPTTESTAPALDP